MGRREALADRIDGFRSNYALALRAADASGHRLLQLSDDDREDIIGALRGTSGLTAADLIAFEAEIAEVFNASKIRAPVHLTGGCEEQLIGIFRTVKPQDWVCGTWRSHYHCLLKGVPRETLKADIIAGRSITLCYPEQRVITSAIVGGVIPIALGLAASIKLGGGPERVHVFVGDMTERTGIFHECLQYATGHALPIRFVVEDNGLSVCTATADVWGREQATEVVRYSYKLPWPHAGAGRRVEF